VNRARTEEATLVLDLATRLGGQMRVGQMGGVIGFDFSAALAMAAALGIDAAAVAEFLPVIERAMVAKMNEAADGQ